MAAAVPNTGATTSAGQCRSRRAHRGRAPPATGTTARGRILHLPPRPRRPVPAAIALRFPTRRQKAISGRRRGAENCPLTFHPQHRRGAAPVGAGWGDARTGPGGSVGLCGDGVGGVWGCAGLGSGDCGAGAGVQPAGTPRRDVCAAALHGRQRAWDPHGIAGRGQCGIAGRGQHPPGWGRCSGA